MRDYGERGYIVRENGPVYFTNDMEKTIKWFKDILKWHGDIISKDIDGCGIYGCVYDCPPEVAAAHITPFKGFHLFAGEPRTGIAGFIMVEGIDILHALVIDNGWSQISKVFEKAWGTRECSITTIDGCILRFFESS